MVRLRNRTRTVHGACSVRFANLTNTNRDEQALRCSVRFGSVRRAHSGYIDDIAIWSNSVEEHAEHVCLIMENLREAGICTSVKKSVLFADEIQFLGHTISSRGVEPAETKVDKVLASRVPSSPSDIKEFLGLVNYIAQFLPGLSEWSTVLSNLTRKGVKFE